MRDTAMRGRSAAFDRTWMVPAIGLLIIAWLSTVLGPQMLLSSLIAVFALSIITARPHWGVCIILTMLMVQYGSRRYERTGWASLLSVLPGGEGLLTINNVLGLFLAVLLVYHVYRDGDWSFLRNRQLQLVVMITVLLITSALVNGVDYKEQAAIGLRVTGQDPMRVLVSRALFLLLFIAFVREKSEFGTIVAVFVVLALITAWSGSQAAISGTADAPQAADYRAGGLGVLIETAGNPNRLAMVATLALIFLWEFGQGRDLRRWGWVVTAAILLLVISVFLSASRGGLVGLVVAGAMLFVSRRASASRILYGLAMLAVAAALIGQLVPQANLERLSNIPGINANMEGAGSGSIERRAYTYGVGLRIWSTAPLLGVGLDNWAYTRFVTDPAHSPAAPHNSYMKVAAEGGALTLISYLMVFGLTIRTLGELERSPAVTAQAVDDKMYWMIRATRICLVTFLVFSLFADLWDLIFFYFLIGLGAALIQRYTPTLRGVPA